MTPAAQGGILRRLCGRRSICVALGLLLGLATFLRFFRLGGPGLWVDEAYTAQMALGPWQDLFSRLRADDAPPLYYVLQAALLRVLGGSEFAVRVLSALASLGALVVIWLWAQRESARTGIFVASVWATSSLAVFYAQQARSYALLHFGVAFLLWSGERLRQQASARNAAAFALGNTLLLYTHNLAVWTVLAAWIWVLPALRTRKRTGLGSLAAAVLLALPWTLSTWDQIGVHGELNAWMGTWWQGRPLWLGPIYSLGAFANGTPTWIRPPVALPGLDPRALLLAYLIAISVVLGLGTAMLRLRRARSVDAGAWILLLAPFAGLLLTTSLVGPAYVVGRTDTLALLPFAALLGLGWSAWRRPLGVVAVAIWAAVGIYVALVPSERAKGADRALAAAVGAEIEVGDRIIVSALGRPTLEYYAGRGDWLARVEIRAFPGALDTNPAAVFATPIDSLAAYEAEARALRARWEREGARRIWILTPLADPASSSGAARGGTERGGGAATTRPGFPAAGAAPAPPPRERASITANDLPYPMSVLVYVLRGLEPVAVLREYRQDWVGGERVVLRLPVETFVDLESLRPIGDAP